MSKMKPGSFSRKLKKAFIITVLIPVLILGGFIFFSSYINMQKENRIKCNNLIDQNILDLEHSVNSCNNQIVYLSANYSLHSFILEKEKSVLDLSRNSSNIESLLYNVLYSNVYFKELRLYTVKENYVRTEIVHSIKEIENEDWYKGALDSSDNYWWREGEKIYLARKIVAAYPNKVIGIIKTEISDKIFSDSFTTFKNVPVSIDLIDNNKKDNIYRNAAFSDSSPEKFIRQLENTDWELDYSIDKDYFNTKIIQNLAAPAALIVVVLILVWILLNLFIKLLSEDLSLLVSEVEDAKKGNLDVKIAKSQIYEINILAESIEGFLNRIKQLIKQVYEKELDKKELELNLLQSKISPHFLYNNLSAINWIAIEKGEDKISEITSELADFYRTALNKGKNIDKMSIEVANIKAYLRLQLIAHEESFKVEYNIDEEVMKLPVPIFIIQPLVENAIEHGIDELREGVGLIKISISKSKDYVIIEVFDNGKSLYDKIGNNYLPLSNYGYGTGNVNKRISLLCGEESGLSIKACEKGTYAVIKYRYTYLNAGI